MWKGFQAIRFGLVGVCLVSIVMVMAGCTEALMPIAAVEHGNATAVQMAGAEGGDAASPAVGVAALSGGAVSLDVKADKVDVCHRTGDGSFQRISVSANALPAHLAHGDLVVGVDADENCAPLTENTPPVAVDDPLGLDPQDPGTWPFDQSGDLSLHATDADGDDLTFSIVPGSLVPAQLDQYGNGVLFFNLDPVTGAWDLLCIGGDGSADPFGSTVGWFQWRANDGQADSNVATQYFNCLV